MTKTAYIVALTFLACGIAFSADYFDEYGVWNPISGVTLGPSAARSAGPIDVTRNEKFINFLITGTTTDSLLLKIDVYGMMSDATADTVDGVLIGTKTEYTDGDAVAFADTLIGDNAFPFVFVRVTNSHPDSSAVVDLYGFTRPIQATVLQVR